MIQRVNKELVSKQSAAKRVASNAPVPVAERKTAAATPQPRMIGRVRLVATSAVSDSAGSVVETVIAIIKNGLRTGRYAPGQRLIEGDICQQTESSRSSVREAMRRLAAEGLVELEHHKGARVRALGIEEALELYEVREVLEGLAARLAARNITRPGNRDRLTRLEENFDKSFDGSPAKYMAYNMAFHRLIVDIADNARLAQLYEQLELPAFLALLHVVVESPPVEVSRAEHRPIVEAILNGREAVAASSMQSHISKTARHVASQVNGTQLMRKPRGRT